MGRLALVAPPKFRLKHYREMSDLTAVLEATEEAPTARGPDKKRATA
jgi:hypothetical protein